VHLSDANQLAHTQAQCHDLIGLSLAQAIDVATSNGLSVRLAREDSTDFILTMDLNLRRINVDITDNRVISASAD
jgi:hypothetical protein